MMNEELKKPVLEGANMEWDKLKIITGDCRTALRDIPDASVQCCVTSPPYWGLRDYGHSDQIGQEETPDAYVETMRQVFAEVWRVLKDDGTLWLNLGDTYNGYMANQRGTGLESERQQSRQYVPPGFGLRAKNLKPKDLVGIPWRVAFALQSDGWYLRSDIIWAKPNCMPESVTDRPTRSHEYLFLLTKRDRYYYNHEAIKEPPSPELLKQIAEGYNGAATKDFSAGLAQDASATKSRIINGYRKRVEKQRGHSRRHDGFNDRWDNLTKEEQMACGSNKRDVWNVAPANYPESHFATFPPDLIKPCILGWFKGG
jgi:DNA modification methylase